MGWPRAARKRGGDLPGMEAGNAAADRGDKEGQLGMGSGEGDELIDMGDDGLRTSLHGGDGVATALQADALSPDSPEVIEGVAGSASSMEALEVAAKDEDLARLQTTDVSRRYQLITHGCCLLSVSFANIVFSFSMKAIICALFYTNLCKVQSFPF